MSKVSVEARSSYLEKVNVYKKHIDEIEKREQLILQVTAKDNTNAPFKKLRLAEDAMNLVSYFVLMNELSVTLLGVKNEPFLNGARKACYKAIIYLEQVVSDNIDGAFSEYLDKLEAIEAYGYEERYSLVRKLGFTIDSMIEGFGENTKWKWSFVEIQGRFATVCKNLMDLKNLYKDLEPDTEGYDIRMAHLNLTRKLLEQSANRYREKYEIVSLRSDDFRLAIKYLEALRKLALILNRSHDLENYRKKISIWEQKLESDLKKSKS